MEVNIIHSLGASKFSLVKKIFKTSTSRHLGLIGLGLGLNQPKMDKAK